MADQDLFNEKDEEMKELLESVREVLDDEPPAEQPPFQPEIPAEYADLAPEED